MEINKVGNIFPQISQSDLKKLQDEANSLIPQIASTETSIDEEIILNATSDIEDIENTSEVKNVVGNNDKVENTKSAQATTEIKTMNEYLDDIENKYDELYKKFDGDTEQIKQYIANNMQEFADIDGDGRITLIDKAIWIQELKTNTPAYALDPKRVTLRTVTDMLTQITSHSSSDLLDLDDVENLFKLCGSWSTLGNLGCAAGLKNALNYSKIAQTENWEERLDNLKANYGQIGGLDGSYNETILSNYLGNNKFASAKDGIEHTVSLVDYYKTQTTYLHYVMNADLSKKQLEEILSKINSASTSVQSQLSEVKKVIEEKLAKL